MQDLVEAFPRVGAQVDVVCKGRGKEGEGAEDEGGAHCGQCLEGQDAERDEGRVFGARPLDHLQLSAVESRQKWMYVDTRDIFFQLASGSRDLQSRARKVNCLART